MQIRAPTKQISVSTKHLYVLTDIENRLVVAKVRGMGGKEWEFGMSRGKLRPYS